MFKLLNIMLLLATLILMLHNRYKLNYYGSVKKRNHYPSVKNRYDYT